MKLSRRSMLRMAGSSGLAVIVGSAVAVGLESPAYAAQTNWRWCFKCQGLFFNGNGFSHNVCPAGLSHSADRSGNYQLRFV
jgi:hypothetical protein